MDRRTFLKASAVTPFCIWEVLEGAEQGPSKFLKSNEKRFDFLEVKGSYKQIGFQIGMFFEKNIRAVIQRRSDWHSKLMTILNSKKGKLLSRELLNLTQKRFPHILQEIEGIADGAGVSFDQFWAMSIKSELLALESEPPGCSTIFFQDEDNMWLFHNEDGDSTYQDIMFTIKVIPPSGVSFISMVYPGIITGNGPSMNSKGIIQTTNYIGSTKSETGLPRYVIGRAILEAKDSKEAIDIATMQPRSYPYHHNIASIAEKRYFSVETVPGLAQIKEPKGVYFHTNHLLFEKTHNYEYQNMEYKNSSSMSRYKVIEEKLKLLNVKKAKPVDFLNILSSHQSAPYSPCRHPVTGAAQGLTLGTAFFDLQNGLFRLYKGNPCEAVPNQLYFDFQF